MDINLHYLILEYVPIDILFKMFKISSTQSNELYLICEKVCKKRFNKTILNTIFSFHCPETLEGNICRKIDETSLKTGYCKHHFSKHKCDDCFRFQKKLKKVKACADSKCCYKSVCINNCKPLHCLECNQQTNTNNMFKHKSNTNDNKTFICRDCLNKKNETENNQYKQVINWYGINKQTWNERYGNIFPDQNDDEDDE